MKLWLLRPIDGARAWEPWYDKAFGFVVRAKDEAGARDLAASEAGDEKREQGKNPWLDRYESTCEELRAPGEAGVVMMDFHAA